MASLLLETGDINSHGGEWIADQDKLAHVVLYNRLEQTPDDVELRPEV